MYPHCTNELDDENELEEAGDEDEDGFLMWQAIFVFVNYLQPTERTFTGKILSLYKCVTSLMQIDLAARDKSNF